MTLDRMTKGSSWIVWASFFVRPTSWFSGNCTIFHVLLSNTFNDSDSFSMTFSWTVTIEISNKVWEGHTKNEFEVIWATFCPITAQNGNLNRCNKDLVQTFFILIQIRQRLNQNWLKIKVIAVKLPYKLNVAQKIYYFNCSFC